jgi:hypothetical protein
MGKIETKKYLYDFFILKKKHFWFLIPTQFFITIKKRFLKPVYIHHHLGLHLGF